MDFRFFFVIEIEIDIAIAIAIAIAIEWASREFGKTNPEAVRNFVASTNLKTLSKKEALKNIH